VTDADFLSREADHRVRNLLALATSVVAHERRSLPTGHEGCRDAFGRVEAQLIAAAALALDKPDREGAPAWFAELCEALRTAIVEPRGHRLVTAGNGSSLSLRSTGLAARAVSELVTNAAKHAYLDAGGTIEVGAEAGPDAALVWVRDEGRGLSPEQLRSERGLGMVRQLAALAGGTCDVRCEQGTTVFLRLPAAVRAP
jgi:two-component sensor histidine kinase